MIGVNWPVVWMVVGNVLIVLGFVFGPILLAILLVQPKVINFVRRWWALLICVGLVLGSATEPSLQPWAESALYCGSFWYLYKIHRYRGGVAMKVVLALGVSWLAGLAGFAGWQLRWLRAK